MHLAPNMYKIVTLNANAKKIITLTLSTPHVPIVTLSHLVQKVPSLELLHAIKFSMRLV